MTPDGVIRHLDRLCFDRRIVRAAIERCWQSAMHRHVDQRQEPAIAHRVRRLLLWMAARAWYDRVLADGPDPHG